MSLRASIITAAVIGAAAMLPTQHAKADQVGGASWYAFHSRTASGARMNPGALTAAHRSLPFGTKVVVQNLNNGRSVVVTINDRGPFVKGRIIDVSQAAASSLGMLGSGTAHVRISAAGLGGGALERAGRGHGLFGGATQVASRSHRHSVEMADYESRRHHHTRSVAVASARHSYGVFGDTPAFLRDHSYRRMETAEGGRRHSRVAYND